MSGTVTFNDTASQGGAPDTGAEPAAQPEATAPVDAGAATEQPRAPDDDSSQPANRRIRALSARVSGLIAENDALKQAAAQRAAAGAPQAMPQTPEELERLIDQRAEAKASEGALKAGAKAFHETGNAAYPDWSDKCQALVDMGADAGISQLLVQMPDGPRIAASLADNPEEMERIADLKSQRGRAIALRKYAESLSAATPAAPRRQVSRAPAPIRPVTGTANPAFNEQTASMDQLLDYYSKQAMDARRSAR